MLKGKRQNFHKSKLPQLGEIVRVKGSYVISHTRKFIVESFPLRDNELPYSIGIHTVHLRALDNGQQIRVSGHLCKDSYDW